MSTVAVDAGEMLAKVGSNGEMSVTHNAKTNSLTDGSARNYLEPNV